MTPSCPTVRSSDFSSVRWSGSGFFLSSGVARPVAIRTASCGLFGVLVGVLAGGLALLSLAGGRRGLGRLQRVGRRDVERLGRHRRRGTARIAILAGLGTGRSLAGAGAGPAACLHLDALPLPRCPAFRTDGIADGYVRVDDR